MEIVLYCQTEGKGRFTCAQAGCQDCLNALLREHEKLVHFVIGRQRLGQAEWAELAQVGLIALWYAIEHYDVERGTRFSTYAYRIIQHRLWYAIACASRAAGWLEAPPHQDRIGELNAEWQCAQLRAVLEESLAGLPEQHRQVLELHWGWDGQAPQTFTQIGQDWQLSRQRIQQIHTEALILLRTPGLSIQLRSLSERHNREAYRAALQKNWKWQRRYRGRG